MSNNSKSGTNSFYLLALRTLPHLNFNLISFVVPFIAAIIAAVIVYFLDAPDRLAFLDITLFLTTIDSALAGIVITGFTLYTAIPNNRRVLHMAITQASKSRFSYFKLSLLYGFKVCFWILNCTLIMIVFYITIKISLNCSISVSDIFQKKILRVVTTFFLTWSQVKIFVELKSFLFSTYIRALTEARLLAIENNKTPFDQGMD